MYLHLYNLILCFSLSLTHTQSFLSFKSREQEMRIEREKKNIEHWLDSIGWVAGFSPNAMMLEHIVNFVAQWECRATVNKAKRQKDNFPPNSVNRPIHTHTPASYIIHESTSTNIHTHTHTFTWRFEWMFEHKYGLCLRKTNPINLSFRMPVFCFCCSSFCHCSFVHLLAFCWRFTRFAMFIARIQLFICFS